MPENINPDSLLEKVLARLGKHKPSPNGLTSFYLELKNPNSTPETIANKFLGIEDGWSKHLFGALAASHCATAILQVIVPKSTPPDRQEDLETMALSGDINIIRAGVLLAKALYLFETNNNPLFARDVLYRVMAEVDKSKASPETKISAMQIFHRVTSSES